MSKNFFSYSMQFGIQQQLPWPRLQHFLQNTYLGPEITFFLVVFVHEKFPHIIFIRILISSERLK